MKNRNRPRSGFLKLRTLAPVLGFAGLILYISYSAGMNAVVSEIKERLTAINGATVSYEDIDYSVFGGLLLFGVNLDIKGEYNLECDIESARARITLDFLRGDTRIKNLTIDSPECHVSFIVNVATNNANGDSAGHHDFASKPMIPENITIKNGVFMIVPGGSGNETTVNISGLSGRFTKSGDNDFSGNLVIESVKAKDTYITGTNANFEINQKTLKIHSFQGNIGDGRVSGDASAEFVRSGKRLSVHANLQNILLDDAFEVSLGRKDIFNGVVSGLMLFDGSLENPLDSEWTAQLRSDSIDLNIPLRLDDHIPSKEDILSLKNLKFTLDGQSRDGKILVDAAAFNDRTELRIENSSLEASPSNDSNNTNYKLDLFMTVTVDNVKKVTDGITGFDTPFDGRMSAHFSIIRDFSGGKHIYSSGDILFTDGRIYQTPSTDPSDRAEKEILFDKFRMEYLYDKGDISLDNILITGKEIRFAAGGDISRKGKIRIKGKGLLSPELATRLETPPAETPYVNYEDDKLVRANFFAGGSTSLPFVYWKTEKDVTEQEHPAQGEAPDRDDRNIARKIGDFIRKVF